MEQKTVFIIGAGASSELNFPTGYDLKKSIANLFTFTRHGYYGYLVDGDEIILDALRNKSVRGQSSYYEACYEISRAMPQAISIDNFLYDRGQNKFIVQCGKLAIVRAILQAEANSLLALKDKQNNIDFSSLGKTWLIDFFQTIRENCKPEDLEERFSSIVLVIFNYDRCIEHYLYLALQNYYSISPEEAASLVNKIHIYHPYGVVGILPWQSVNQPNHIKYGEVPYSGIWLLSEEIKTFTEQVEEPTAMSRLELFRSYIRKSKKIIFLGFGFHSLNLDLLFPKSETFLSVRNNTFKIYATGQGLSNISQRMIENDLKRRLFGEGLTGDIRNFVDISSFGCFHFFQNYKRVLSFLDKIE